MEKVDYVVCECDLAPLENFVTELEKNYQIQIAKAPGICLTMVKAEDSMELQPFYLGEALTTECEVIINERIGYGICLGDEPIRSYCIAVIDALMQLNDQSKPVIEQFLTNEYQGIQHRNKVEYNHILRTKVDFKLMEQE